MSGRLDFGWRLLATGFCFAGFGIGGAILGMALFPLIAAWPAARATRLRWTQGLVRSAFRLFLASVQILGVGRISVINRELLATATPQLVLANHPTLLDVVVVVSLMPQADCVVKQALWRNPFLRSVVRGAGYIGNSSPQAVMDECATSLAEHRSLMLFPEGTRSTPGIPLAFQRGAARIALNTGAAILPVTLTCEPATLMKNTPWYRIPRQRWHIRVMAHTPVNAGELTETRELSESMAVRRMTRALQELFERKLEEHDNAYRRTA